MAALLALTRVVIKALAQLGCFRFIVNTYCSSCGCGLLERLCNDKADVLTPVADDLVLQCRTNFTVCGVVVTRNGSIKRTNVAVMQDEKDAGHFLRSRGVKT